MLPRCPLGLGTPRDPPGIAQGSPRDLPEGPLGVAGAPIFDYSCTVLSLWSLPRFAAPPVFDYSCTVLPLWSVTRFAGAPVFDYSCIVLPLWSLPRFADAPVFDYSCTVLPLVGLSVLPRCPLGLGPPRDPLTVGTT